MSSAPIHRDLTTKTQVAVRRGAPGAQAGARGVTTSRAAAGVQGEGEQEVFVEPYDEAVSFARGYVHITFDPDGTYTAP